MQSFSLSLQTVTSIEGNTFKTETQVNDSLKVTRLYEFSDNELLVVNIFFFLSFNECCFIYKKIQTKF